MTRETRQPVTCACCGKSVEKCSDCGLPIEWCNANATARILEEKCEALRVGYESQRLRADRATYNQHQAEKLLDHYATFRRRWLALDLETYFARVRDDGSVETVEEYVARIESELRRSKSENHGDGQ